MDLVGYERLREPSRVVNRRPLTPLHVILAELRARLDCACGLSRAICSAIDELGCGRCCQYCIHAPAADRG